MWEDNWKISIQEKKERERRSSPKEHKISLKAAAGIPTAAIPREYFHLEAAGKNTP